MGHPRKHRKKYDTPKHPWQASRIEVERKISDEYGLKTKKEIWKIGSKIKRFRDQAKNLISDTTEQGVRETKQLLSRLGKLNLIQSNSIDEVLKLDIKNLLERRLQTFVYKKNLAKTINQARQFIVHGHIGIDGKRINSPSYLVLKDEENKIGFLPNSDLSREDHPERVKKEEEKKIKKEVKKEEKEEKKEEAKEKEIKKEIKKEDKAEDKTKEAKADGKENAKKSK